MDVSHKMFSRRRKIAYFLRNYFSALCSDGGSTGESEESADSVSGLGGPRGAEHRPDGFVEHIFQALGG